MLMMLLALQAQLPPAAPERPACALVEAGRSPPAQDAAPVRLQALCGERAMPLGAAERYRSAYNATLKSLLVETSDRADKRVVLVTLGQDGTPHVDDITRELTRLSGRYAEAGLADVAVEIGDFADGGTVSVPVRTAAAPDFLALRNGGAAGKGAATASGAATTAPPAAPAAALLDLRPYAARAAATAPAPAADLHPAQATAPAR